MKTVENENVNFFDVDGTLVLHEEVDEFDDNYLKVKDSMGNGHIVVRVHQPMVRLLKESHARGFYIIVWSKGGYQWAANVIEALGLEKQVHLVMSKPEVYFDDTPIDKWLTSRVFLPADTIYKQTHN